jgi:hypothetical protein
MIGVVAFITDGGSRIEAIDKLMCEGDVVALPRRTDQAERIAGRVTGGVDFKTSLDRLKSFNDERFRQTGLGPLLEGRE